MPTYLAPICLWCTRFHGNQGRPFTCDAFPDEIPDDIFFTSRIDHRKPVRGDHGLQFEEDPHDPLPELLRQLH